MGIDFNPNLPPNDSLSPKEIEERVKARNDETRFLTEKAYLTGGVPPSHSEKAANHSSVTRQTPEAKKARRDAKTWYEAKNPEEDEGRNWYQSVSSAFEDYDDE